MPDFFSGALLFTVGFLSSILNVFAGGGSSITLPVLIFMGLDPATANGTNRIGILAQCFFASATFHRENHYNFRESLTLTLFTLPGAVAGALCSISIDDVWFERILGLVMIGIVLTLVLPSPGSAGSQNAPTPRRRWLTFLSMTGIGFYGGFIQVGVGFLLMAALYHILRMPLVRVNMHKVFIVFFYTIPALAVFLLTGHVEWKTGLILAGGMSVGAWFAARLALRSHNRTVRILLVVAIVVMALKLLGVY
jgi:uncharacterized membrane protein YfcA